MKAKLSELSVIREGSPTANRLPELALPHESEGEAFDAVAKAIAANGAVVLRGLVSRDLVADLRTALAKALEDDARRYGPDYIFGGMVHALITRGKPFHDLLAVPAVQGAMRAVLGKGCIVHAYNSSSMPPGKTNYSRGIHVDCPRLIPNYVTNLGLTLALDPFTSENGAMEIAPALRHRFAPPSEAEFVQARHVLDHLLPGDAVLFDARCWHRGGVNRTNQWRHAATMNVVRSYMRQQFDFPRFIDAATAAGFDESVRQFLGYNVRMPVSMEEFLAPPDQRPYKPGQE